MSRFRNALRLGAAAALVAACSAGPKQPQGKRIVVSTLDSDLGSPEARLPLSSRTPARFRLRIEAQTRRGLIDGNANGYVRLEAKPGSLSIVGGTSGRNVKLENGVADGVEVEVLGAFGDARIWVEDVGYVPGAVSSDVPPACANGIDDDGDGLVDAPSDPGCFSANDDTEEGGTFAIGVTPTMYFAQPRIADLLGAETGGTATPFKGQEVFLDTGWRKPEPNPENPGTLTPERFDFDVVITRISANGFFVTDLGETPYAAAARAEDPSRNPGYPFGSAFSFTFSAPGGLRVCDRIRSLNGTVAEFYGAVQLSSPSYVIEPWDSRKRPCLVPEPFVLLTKDLDPENQSTLQKHKAALVRVASENGVAVSVAAHFGRGFPAAPDYLPTEDASNCDFDGSGEVDFNVARNPAEAACAKACQDDPECAEFSNFVQRGTFVLTVRDGDAARKVQANAFASPSFKPLELRGQAIRAFTGTLNYFSGGSQFTIESRCDDDVVIDPAGAPKPSNEACVRPRTIQDTNENSQ